MPEMSEERVWWMRNRFVEVLARAESMSQELVLIREEISQVVDALAAMLPEEGRDQPRD